MIVAAGPLTIRSLLPTDIAPLVGILREAHVRPDGTVPARYDTTALTRMLFASLSSFCPHKAEVLVADIDAAPVGLITYGTSRLAAMGWEIAYWATAPLYQGAGIGTRLLDAALTRIRWDACGDDFVMVRTALPTAFECRGFRPLQDDPAMMRAAVRNLRVAEPGCMAVPAVGEAA